MNEPWAYPATPGGRGAVQGWVSKAGVPSETLNPAAWEYLYCVRKYLVDETGQTRSGLVVVRIRPCPVAWLQSGVDHLVGLWSASQSVGRLWSVASAA